MEDSVLIQFGLPLSLAIIMLGMGLKLAPSDFKVIPQHPKGVLLGIFLQFIAMPATGFAVGHLAGGGAIAISLVICASLPGGVTSNLFTYLAKGNLALSVVLTVISSLVTIASIPFFTELACTVFTGTLQQFTLPLGRTLFSIFGVVILPIALGMLANRFLPTLAKKSNKPIDRFSAVVLALLIGFIVYAERNRMLSHLTSTSAYILLLMFSTIALTFALSHLIDLKTRDRFTLAIESTIKNATLGLTILLVLLQQPQMAVPVAVYGLLMYPVAGVLVWVSRRQPSQP